MLYLLILVCVQFVIMLIKLKEVLSQELKCLNRGMNKTKNYGCGTYICIVL
jgi:hypothetical protein